MKDLLEEVLGMYENMEMAKEDAVSDVEHLHEYTKDLKAEIATLRSQLTNLEYWCAHEEG